MSSGNFVIGRYTATYDNTQIHPIRVQPETLELSLTIGAGSVTNASAAGAINNPISAIVSKSRRGIGLVARIMRVRFTGEPPTDYQENGVITLPVVNPALMSAPKGATGTYLGAAIVLVGMTPERVG